MTGELRIRWLYLNRVREKMKNVLLNLQETGAMRGLVSLSINKADCFMGCNVVKP